MTGTENVLTESASPMYIAPRSGRCLGNMCGISFLLVYLQQRRNAELYTEPDEHKTVLEDNLRKDLLDLRAMQDEARGRCW